MFELFAAAIAIAALIFAKKATDKVQGLTERVTELEHLFATGAVTAKPATTPTAPTASSATIPLAPTPEPVRTPPPPPDIPPTPVEPPYVQPYVRPYVAASTAAPEIIASPVEQPAEPATPPPPPPPPPRPPTPPEISTPGFEERIGTRWVVWLGGLTLALGGIFMVRYSIEAGLLGPAVRTTLSGLFAAALIATGEWARRRDTLPQMPWSEVANIPAILTAAGTAVAFATIYAAYALYGFLSPPVAFIGLGIVALATLAAALLHGPALAGLGIAGAFVTPLLVSSDRPDFWALYIYLAVVTAAGFALARIRLWQWLAITTLAFAVLWTLPGLYNLFWLPQHLFHVTAGFALAALLVVCGFMFGPQGEESRIEPISSVSLSAYLFASTLIVITSGYTDASLIIFAVLVGAALFVAWKAEAAAGAVAAAGGLVAIVFGLWALRTNPGLLNVPAGALPGIPPVAGEDSSSLQLTLAVGFAAAFGVTGAFAQGRSTRAVVPVIWSAAAVAVPLTLLIALYGRVAHIDRSIPFSLAAFILAVAFGVTTEWLVRRTQKPGMMISTALFATGALAALALTLTFALERGWLTISFALVSAATAWVSLKRPIPFLRWLSGFFASIVLVRIGMEPRIAGDQVGTTPIFNWLLYGYGVPALSFWIAGHLLRKRRDDTPSRTVDSAAILFTVLLAFMEIRHTMNGGDVYTASTGLAETALQVCTALAMAIGLERIQRKSGSVVHWVSLQILSVLALIAIAGGLLLFKNPLFTGEPIDGAVINMLLLGYAMPAVLATILARCLKGRENATNYPVIMGATGLALLLVYLLLEIRRLFHGPVIASGWTDLAEVGVQICVVIVLAIGLDRLQRRTGDIVHKVGAFVVGILALAGIGGGLLLFQNPMFSNQLIDGSFFNLLLIGYALPAVLVTILARSLKGPNEVPFYTVVMGATGLALLIVYLLLEIRRLFHGPALAIGNPDLAEVAVQVCLLIVVTIGLERLQRRTGDIVHKVGAFVVGILALIGIGCGLLTFQNPMVTGQPINGAFINLLLLGYALPAILTALLAWTLDSRDDIKAYTHVVAGATLALALAYVSLEIRRLYQGPLMAGGYIGDAEQYTYSLAWLAFGVILLGAGLFRDLQRARLASAVVIALTIAKVFFVDMSALTGAWRALSFMGLGLVLIAIGWFYQRILFKPAATQANAASS